MRIWLILDGSKQGPFTVYEIIERIQACELPATTYAWHEGMREWKPIGEIDSFRHEYEIPEDVEGDDLEDVTSAIPQSALEPVTKGDLWRRWLARVFDFTVWQSLCFGLAASWHLPVKEWIYNGVFLLYVMPLWIPVEAMMLHFLSWTPGKAMLNLRVTNADRSPLSIGVAMIRSLRTFLMGMGASYPPLLLLCHWFGWWYTRRNGIALWDVPLRIQVSSRPLPWWRWVTLVMVWMLLNNILATPGLPTLIEIMKERNPNAPVLKYLEK